MSTHRAEIFPYPDIKNLVETYAILIISLVSLIEICSRFLFEISSSNLVEILIIIQHLIYYYVYQKLVEIVS